MVIFYFIFILNIFLTISFDKALQIDSNNLDAQNNKGFALQIVQENMKKQLNGNFLFYFYFKYFSNYQFR